MMDREAWRAVCSPWGHKQSDTIEWLNWTELKENDRKQIEENRKQTGSWTFRPTVMNLKHFWQEEA